MHNEYDPLKQILNNPDWKAVETVVSEQISKLLDLREVDMTLSPEALKIELRARDLASDILIEFYTAYKFTHRTKEENQAPFR